MFTSLRILGQMSCLTSLFILGCSKMDSSDPKVNTSDIINHQIYEPLDRSGWSRCTIESEQEQDGLYASIKLLEWNDDRLAVSYQLDLRYVKGHFWGFTRHVGEKVDFHIHFFDKDLKRLPQEAQEHILLDEDFTDYKILHWENVFHVDCPPRAVYISVQLGSQLETKPLVIPGRPV